MSNVASPLGNTRTSLGRIHRCMRVPCPRPVIWGILYAARPPPPGNRVGRKERGILRIPRSLGKPLRCETQPTEQTGQMKRTGAGLVNGVNLKPPHFLGSILVLGSVNNSKSCKIHPRRLAARNGACTPEALHMGGVASHSMALTLKKNRKRTRRKKQRTNLVGASPDKNRREKEGEKDRNVNTGKETKTEEAKEAKARREKTQADLNT